MILGTGIDLIEIERIKKVFENRERKYLEKVFTEEELRYSFSFKDPYTHLAARFCAKEAFYKAIGEGFFILHEIGIVNKKNGKPEIQLFGKTLEMWKSKGSPSVFVSLSHSSTMAMAIVILEK